MSRTDGLPIGWTNNIICGDSFELVKSIPDESVDMILCDPVYWDIQQYEFVVKTAERALVDGGNVVVQCGIEFRFEIEKIFHDSSLTPHPLICEVFTGGNAKMWAHRSFNCWHPYVWFSKGEKRNGEWIRDLMRGGGRAKGLHEWGDSVGIFISLVERLCPENGIVLDLFAGSGTVAAACKMLNRYWIGFEIDEETAKMANKRVAETPMPLFVPPVEQLEFELEGDEL